MGPVVRVWQVTVCPLVGPEGVQDAVGTQPVSLSRHDEVPTGLQDDVLTQPLTLWQAVAFPLEFVFHTPELLRVLVHEVAFATWTQFGVTVVPLRVPIAQEYLVESQLLTDFHLPEPLYHW